MLEPGEKDMAPSPSLMAYLAMERTMLYLDAAARGSAAAADELRDRMDPIWLSLTEEDRCALDNRSGDASVFAGTVVEGAP